MRTGVGVTSVCLCACLSRVPVRERARCTVFCDDLGDDALEVGFGLQQAALRT